MSENIAILASLVYTDFYVTIFNSNEFHVPFCRNPDDSVPIIYS